MLPMGFGKSLILSTVCFWEEQYYTHNYHRGHDIQTFCPIEFQGSLYSVNCSLKIKHTFSCCLKHSALLVFLLHQGASTGYIDVSIIPLISDHLENCYMYIFQKMYF